MTIVWYTAIVAAMFVGLAIVLTGIGLLVRRLCGLREVTPADLLLAPWLGWAAALVVLQLWHLFWPVDRRAFAVALALGAGGFLCSARPLAALLGRLAHRYAGLLVVGLLAALWVANHTTTQARVVDSGLYHLSSVRWANEYPIVPGLGNLHGRLAFNNSYFLYAALLNTGSFAGRAHHLANGLLLFLALARALAAGWRLLERDRAPCVGDVFDALFCAPILLYAMAEPASSPTPDVAVALLGIVVSSETLRLLAGKRGSDARGGPADASRVWAVALLAAAGITVKLSFAVFGALAAALVLAVAMRSGSAADARRLLAGAAAAWAAALVPWVVRGYVLSGYPFYPSAALGLPLPWRMPAPLVQLHADWVASWARRPYAPVGDVLGNWRWLWPWLNGMLRHNCHVMVPLALALVVAPAVGWLHRGRLAWDRARAGLFLIPPACGLLFWFFAAPEHRFAGSAFWVLGLGALAVALRAADALTVRTVVIGLTAVLLANNADVFEFLRPWRRDISPAPCGSVTPERTASGLVVYVPREGGFCWDAPLPCTDRVNPGLRLRCPGDLGGGFVIDPAPPATGP